MKHLESIPKVHNDKDIYADILEDVDEAIAKLSLRNQKMVALIAGPLKL